MQLNNIIQFPIKTTSVKRETYAGRVVKRAHEIASEDVFFEAAIMNRALVELRKKGWEAKGSKSGVVYFTHHQIISNVPISLQHALEIQRGVIDKLPTGRGDVA